MAGGRPSSRTASATFPKKHVPVGGTKIAAPTELSIPQQGAERDWQFLMWIVFGLMLLLTGPLIANILVTALSILVTALSVVLIIPNQLFWCLVTDDSGFPVVSLLLLVTAYGGYAIMPIWLGQSVEKTSAQVGNDVGMKHSIDVACLVEMGYAPVATSHSFFETNPIIGADGKIHCPVVVAVVKPAHTVVSATSPGRPILPLISEDPRVDNDNNIAAQVGNDLSHSNVAPDIPVVKGDSPSQHEPVAGPIDTPHELRERFAVANEPHTNASINREEMAVAGVKTGGHPKDSPYSLDDNSGSNVPTSSASPVSKSSPMMPQSSFESEFRAEADLGDDALEHMSSVPLPFPHLKHLTPIELDNLMKIHGHPTFHEGNLFEVWYDEEKFDEEYPGMSEDIQSLIRPISHDEKDVKFMMEVLRAHLPGANLPRSRKDFDGLNLRITEIGLLWARHNGDFANLEAVHNSEKEKTRRRRLAAPPGLPNNRPSVYREFLSERHLVDLNEGCIDYGVTIADAAKSKFLSGLNNRPDMNDSLEDKSGNQVPPWLDGVEEEQLNDPNAYLPCECGKSALATHLMHRRKDEAGTYRCPEDYQPPKLTFLSEEALKEDVERKVLEEAHSNALAECPRATTFRQTCDLHAVPTNLPWILMDGVEDLNAILVGPGDDLPVPGFKNRTKYPDGYSMPQFFYDNIESLTKQRLPRCEHGKKHPHFADHCVHCFPNGEHHDDCAEYSAHVDVREIMKDPYKEDLCELWAEMAERDDDGTSDNLLKRARAAAYHADWYVSWERNTANILYEENRLSWPDD
ncbi:hypothetical protein B5807_01091 [Epicoccum nigrum]|uniref:Uncharacterized protein n=1 Tax=Epicoccum nigrum TaxID=105696 RepID=A0A1Y2MDF3_EPING|nr:hypothetical protein B5807_01091 [Epicoccum nigrum]